MKYSVIPTRTELRCTPFRNTVDYNAERLELLHARNQIALV